jgi:hypothetical protein
VDTVGIREIDLRIHEEVWGAYGDNVGIRGIDDTILLEARFVPLDDDGLLWEKDSVCYGRHAALQRALRKLHEEEGVYLSDRT